ncbi:MAG TPA: NAD-dependent epimerase/dehydratase family protein, partial [Fimbriiglobus sp.]
MDLTSFTGRSVVLTGATGFVGYHLAKRLVVLGARVTALTRAGSKTDRLRSIGVACRIAPLDRPAEIVEAITGADLLFHVAGAVDFDDDWDRFRATNVEGTRSVLNACRSAGVRRVVHVSSIVAVGAGRTSVPLDEAAKWNLGPLRIPYVTTKREAEDLALAAAASGQDVRIANPGCVIGPDDFSESEFGNLCRRFWKGKVPIHFSGGNNFVDVRDVADGLLRIAERGRVGERYILGGWNRTYARFFGELARYGDRRHPRLTLPACMAPAMAIAEKRFRKRGARPVLSPEQA